jgi:cephalosporin-C deacetylase
MRHIISLLMLFVLGVHSLNAGNLLLLGKNDKPSPFYDAGEQMTFEIRLERDGRPVADTHLSWTRTGDDGLVTKGQEVSTVAPLVITTSTARPGFVRILVKALDAEGNPILNERKQEVIFDGGAGVQPDRLESVPEPADFDAWWASQKTLLAQVPPDVLERKQVVSTQVNVETWDVKIACAGPVLPSDSVPKPVSGYLSKTRNAAPKSAEAIVYFHGYGVRSSIRRDEEANDPANPKLIFDINAHGIENGASAAFYEKLGQTTLRGYAFTHAQNERPETAYVYGMALRVLRALEFIKAQPEWDGKRLTVSGGSQGAFQSILAAALDADVTRCNAWKPWFCDLGGVTLGRIKGWRPEHTRALDYYDPVNHAKRIRATTYITAGLGDYVCPPSGVAVLYNNITASVYKRIEYRQGATHGTSPPDMVTFVVGDKP